MSLRRPRVLRAVWRRRAVGDPALGWALAVAAESERRFARAVQEMEGWRRQDGRRRREAEVKGRQAAAQALLAAIDGLDKALEAPDAPEGLAMVRDGLLQALRDLGAEEVPGQGSPVDPANHEVVGGTGSVVGRVLRRGLRLDGRLVRPAMVEVVE